MPELKTRQELADAAKILALSTELVQRATTTFIPVNWQTMSPDPPPAPHEKIWLPLTRDDKRRLGNLKANILFASDSELKNFDFMVQQHAIQDDETVKGILVKTTEGLRRLTSEGQLVTHDATFTPNCLQPVLNTDPADKKEVWDAIVGWVGGEEEALSLVHHLATALDPTYPAVKYVLLIGQGRNGKGVLISMILGLFGQANVSNITRQMMSEALPTVLEVNDKLLNLVFDGPATFLKDSSLEKTILAGEPGVVRRLYESGTSRVQSNALFVEALNKEPNTSDKTPAVQKRLARFYFGNTFPLNHAFQRHMTSERMLGAFLSLLIDNFVKIEELGEKLALTEQSMEMQLEQVWMGSPVLQHLETLNPAELDKLSAGQMEVDVYMASFRPWAETQNMPERTDAHLLSMMKQSFDIGRKTIRVNGKPTSRRFIRALREETLAALQQMEGDTNDVEDFDEELVGG